MNDQYVDESCPLRGDDTHRCANRDWAQRIAAGLSPLREGSACHAGACAHLLTQLHELDAQGAAFDVAKKAARLIDVMLDGELPVFADSEVSDLIGALSAFSFTARLAGWGVS